METFPASGCRFCHEGAKMVLFITGVCHRSCWYCPLSRERKGTDTVFANEHPVDIPAQIIEVAENMSALGTGITGGEPLLQEDCLPLLEALVERQFTVLLETNGSRPLEATDPRVHRIMDLKCPGSGMADHNYLANLEHLTSHDEVKLVIGDRSDFAWAVELVRAHRLTERGPVLISPIFGVLPPAEAAAWIVASGLPLRLNLQLHKYIWGPEARGV